MRLLRLRSVTAAPLSLLTIAEQSFHRRFRWKAIHPEKAQSILNVNALINVRYKALRSPVLYGQADRYFQSGHILINRT